jgi:flagellar basal-body rod protein FlgC
MKSLALVSVLSLSTAHAAFSACEQLTIEKMKMQVTASNMINTRTTRTPEGGPYQHKKLQCQDAKCEIVSEPQIKKVYEPDHPDAGADGYVLYPDIDPAAENEAMQLAMNNYEDAARTCFAK